jgi:predicted RNase H-like nuclease (RuvC/YqgF family)
MAMVRALALAAILAAAGQGAFGQNYLYQNIQATVLVADPERAADALEQWTEQAGGYTLLKASDRVILRLPFQRIPQLRETLRELSEDILELSPRSQDLREAILETQAKISSREEVLERNLAMLDRADVEGTLAIEREILALIEEIEGLKATLQKLNQERSFSRAEISLQYLEQSLPENIPSSFDWINGVDFYSFIRQGLSREGG